MVPVKVNEIDDMPKPHAVDHVTQGPTQHQRQVFAANATIGQTRAAFYPTISLNLLYGLQDTGFNLFSLPNDFWTFGPGLVMPLLEGGLEDPKVNRDFLERASNGVDRMIRMVEDLDLITQLESGRGLQGELIHVHAKHVGKIPV